MTVLDHLRAHEHCADREHQLKERAQVLLDVLTGDLEKAALYAALQDATGELAALLVELDDQPPASGNATRDEGGKTGSGTARKTAGKKKSTRKAARRSVNPPSRTAGQADTKRCPDCDTVKSAAEFGRHARTKDGLQPRCRPCAGKRTKAGRDAQAKKSEKPSAPRQFSDADQTLAELTPISTTDDLVAVCPVHSVVAREPAADVTIPAEAWLFTARSNHRLNHRCERDLELRQGAAT